MFKDVLHVMRSLSIGSIGLFFLSLQLFGCSSSFVSKTGPEKERPLLNCPKEKIQDAHDRGRYLIACATGRGLVEDMALQIARSNAVDDITRQAKSRFGDSFVQEAVQNRSISAGKEKQAKTFKDSVSTMAAEVVNQKLTGTKILERDFFNRREEQNVWLVDVAVGVPVGEAATELTEELRQNPAFEEISGDENLKRWVKEALWHSFSQGTLKGSGGAEGTSRR